MLIKMNNEKEQPGDHLDGRNWKRVQYGFHQTWRGGRINGCEKCIFNSGIHTCSLKKDTPMPTMEEEANEFQKNFFETKLDS